MDDTGGEKGEDDKEDFLVLDINDEDKIGMSVDEEEEEDFLLLGVNDEDKIGMSVDEEEEEEEVATKKPSNTEKKMTSQNPDKGSKKRKHKKKHKHKKHRNKDEVEVGEPEAGPSISPEENYEDKRRRRRRERLEAQTEKDRPAEDSDKVILNESTVYSMGNYCSTMLAGLKCNETSCSWSHVMLATDAASQFSKILQFR